MDKFLVMLGNWKSTLIGLLMGLVIYEAGVGNKFPATAQEWWALGLGVLAITLGVVTKDATTGSRPLVLLLALPLLGGCALSPSADVIKAMAGDPATVCVQVNTIYGTVRVARTNITQGNVACNGDGLSVKSEAASVGVPLNVVPQVTIGVPTFTVPK